MRTSLGEPSAELGVGRQLNVEIAFDLPSLLPQLLPARFLQLEIRIRHLDLSKFKSGSEFTMVPSPMIQRLVLVQLFTVGLSGLGSSSSSSLGLSLLGKKERRARFR